MNIKPAGLYFFSTAIFAVILLTGCNGLRKLGPDQYLLSKNTIKTNRTDLREEMSAIIKQKPNRRILGLFRFHLGIYNLANQGRKSTKFKEWIKRTIGEAPVIHDSLLTRRSADQLYIYMQNHGYFSADVSFDVKYSGSHKASVIYNIISGEPYTINKIEYNIKDSSLAPVILNDTANSLIHYGDNYDTGVLQKERERISIMLKNLGYYFFSPLYITYSVDSSFGANKVNLYMQVNNPSPRDTTEPSAHLPFRINNVYIQTDYDPIAEHSSAETDTTNYNGYFFVSAEKRHIYNYRLLLEHVFIAPGDLYRFKGLEDTYKHLQELGIFKFIIVKYERIPGTLLLNCNILLSPAARQDYKIEGEGTNTGGNLGIAGNLSYRNKNTFRGAEQFEFRIKGGIEAQKEITDTIHENTNLALFNTYEIGPEVSLAVPRILMPFTRGVKFNSPQTNFLAGYNLQQRPEYRRTLANLSYSINFRESKYKRHYFYLGEINFVKVKLQELFREKLLQLNDAALINSYEDQLISDFRYVFVYNSQELGKLKNYFYFRGTFESAGHFIGLYNSLRGNTDSQQRIDIFNVPYAQYLRPDIDFRFYQVFGEGEKLVYRFAAGMGYAYGNSALMPFEKSFYAGGSNDLRAWRARSLGPGAYSNKERFEKTGDLKLNANLEYRFDIFRKLKGAFFTDAGNIWLIKNDESRPAGHFENTKWIDQVALGTGMGLRLDFTFFILRFDWGIQLKDPSLPASEQWVIRNASVKYSVLNFGIGYPF